MNTSTGKSHTHAPKVNSDIRRPIHRWWKQICESPHGFWTLG